MSLNSERVLLRCRHVTKRFGGMVALSDVGLEIHAAELVGLIGPNGAGKTTLLNVINGLLRPDRGVVELDEQPISGMPPHAVTRRGVGRVLQIPRLFPHLTVEENVLVGALFGRHGQVTHNEARASAAEALAVVGLEEKRSERVARLNTQERRLVDLARALAARPRMMLVDELMSGLNPVEVRRGTALLRRIRAGLGVAILWVEHVMEAVLGTVDRVIVLNYGAVIADGPPERVARDPAVVEAYLGAPLEQVAPVEG